MIRRFLPTLFLLALAVGWQVTAWAWPQGFFNLLHPARRAYNRGTTHLQAGQLPEAETALLAAVTAADDDVLSSALYNLALTRFRLGEASLRRIPAPTDLTALAGQATQAGRLAEAALAGQDLEPLVRAYLTGRGIRKQLKAAQDAVKTTLTAQGEVLRLWQRAAEDFPGVAELAPPDIPALENADWVRRHIAKLVDERVRMEQQAKTLARLRGELGRRLRAIRKRLPEPQRQDGDNDDDEEETPPPPEPKAGQKEDQMKEGQEQHLTPAEAVRLLQSLKLDSNRRLPMGEQRTGVDKKRQGRDW